MVLVLVRVYTGAGILMVAPRRSGSGLLALALLRFSGCGGGCRGQARALRAFALCLQQPVRDWFVIQLCITQGSLQLRNALALGTAPGFSQQPLRCPLRGLL